MSNQETLHSLENPVMHALLPQHDALSEEAKALAQLAPKPLPGYVPPSSGVYNLSIGCEFIHEANFPTPAILQIEPRRRSASTRGAGGAGPQTHRILREEFSVEPFVPSQIYFDVYGNLCRRLMLPAGHSVIRYDALAEVAAAPDESDANARAYNVEELPDETLLFTMASRYCQSDLLIDTAWQLFGETQPTMARLQALSTWVHENIRYVTGSSNFATTALDVFDDKTGICRDFAHVGVTLCRALSIPARYCYGYFPDIGVVAPSTDMDFHAWFEAYLGGGWQTFDARHNEPRIGRVVIGRGRDAVDVALTTSYGAARLEKMTVWADEVTADNPGGPPLEDDADSLESASQGTEGAAMRAAAESA